jgi:hypothetical protein
MGLIVLSYNKITLHGFCACHESYLSSSFLNVIKPLLGSFFRLTHVLSNLIFIAKALRFKHAADFLSKEEFVELFTFDSNTAQNIIEINSSSKVNRVLNSFSLISI